MAFAIETETALQDDVGTMVAALGPHLQPLSPPVVQFRVTVEEMAGADCTVFLVRDEAGEPVGMGCLKGHPGGVGEIKRIWAAPELRGQGVGASILAAIVARARAQGLSELVLETGASPDYAPAWALYERAGFRPCGAVLDYPSSDQNRYYRKVLSA